MVRKQRIGVVVSNKATKTVTVAIKIRYQHPKYLKTLTKTKKYLVHDQNSISKVGDIILIEETAPISKRKFWQIKEIISSYQELT
jgi:small subunit ribosomal protein S17